MFKNILLVSVNKTSVVSIKDKIIGSKTIKCFLFLFNMCIPYIQVLVISSIYHQSIQC